MARRTHHGWADTISYNIHKKVRYRPTRQHAKLLNLEISYVSYALVHLKYLFIRTQSTRALNNTDGSYHLKASNIRSYHSSSFSSSILHFSLIAQLLDLQLYQSFDHLTKPHRSSINRKGSQANFNHSSSIKSLHH
jgi:hypothetical protein